MHRLLLLLVLWCSFMLPAWAAAPVVLLTLKGPIVPVAASYVERGIKAAEREGAQAVVLQLDTPGGLVDSMRELNQAVIGAPMPVIVWVGPSGARAASAGVFITAASHVAAMAPGTHIGAASVVGGQGEELPKTMEAKVTNDAVAYLKAIGEERGRNVVWLEKAVRQAASISAKEALDKNVIDLLATDVPTLLDKVDGRKVKLATGSVTLATAKATVVPVEMNWFERVLYALSNPNIAYILLSIGTLALLAEMSQPGMIFPGVFGAICLLLALYSLGSLPVNYAGVGLILLGIVLLVAEMYVVSAGVLFVGGMVAFILGSIMLINQGGGMPGIDWSLIVVAAGTIGFFGFFAIKAVWRSFSRPVITGGESLIGQTAVVRTALSPNGFVLVEGERWEARSTAGTLPPGAEVVIVGIEGLRLTVAPQQDRIEGMRQAEAP